MNWKPFMKLGLFCLAFYFILFILDIWDGNAQRFGAHHRISDLILVITMALVMVGLQELDRGEHLEVRRKLVICSIVLLIVTFIAFFTYNHLHRNMNGLDFRGEYLFIPLGIFYWAIFPLSLYLNRKRKKSTTQPADANVS